MSLINPAILYGLGLAAIPVILHFLLRSRPKKLMFPALQLIIVRRRNNVRRLRIRHLWLLLLRILVIALLVLAITRPSLPAANYGLNRRETLVLLAIVFSTAAGYWFWLRYWRRQRLSNHDFAYRRTLLRGGTGLLGLLLGLLLVAWPYKNRIAAEITAPMPDIAENLPVAGVFLFDTSLSMQYQLENRTRLDRAGEIAVEHLSNLPAGSQVAVTDTSTDDDVLFQADLVAAKSRIDALEIHPVAVPMNDRLRVALMAQEDHRRRVIDELGSGVDESEQDRFLREVYIFTDLAASGWRMAASRRLRDELAQLPWVQVYVIDVSVEEPQNFSVTPLRLSKQTLPLEGELLITATVDATGMRDQERLLELYVDDLSGRPVKKGTKLVKPGDQVHFPVRGLTAPISRGEVRLVSSDPLPADDVRYFTVEVRPPPQVLVINESREEAQFWLVALQAGDRRYRVESRHASQLEDIDLKPYAAVCLMNLEAPSAKSWSKLSRYVESGGGLAVVVGNSRVDPVSYNKQVPQSFLPAKLLARLPFTPPERLDLGRLEHPVLKKFGILGGAAELSSVDVHRYWRVETHTDASVIAPYSDWRSDPALLERVHGDGRTLMLTTAVDRKRWTDFPSTGWPFFVFVDQVVHYLTRQTSRQFNYTTSDRVIVALDPDKPISRYLLQKPDSFRQLPGNVPEGEQTLLLTDVEQLGNYTLIAADKESSYKTGFSINPPDGESDFRRLQLGDLDLLFGEGRYELAQNIDELTRRVHRGRLGQEIFPFVLLFVMIAFCGEHFVANRFYDAEQAPEHR